MKEHPILFTSAMVRAILSGAKTQTRRVLKYQPRPEWTEIAVEYRYGRATATYRAFPDGGSARWSICECPLGGEGDVLWVRETWDLWACLEDRLTKTFIAHVAYRATDTISEFTVPRELGVRLQDEIKRSPERKWRPSIFMPRGFCRITLRIKSVRVERLQEISEEDAQAEGFLATQNARGEGSTATDWFMHIWDATYAKKYPWASNPWCWCIQFERT